MPTVVGEIKRFFRDTSLVGAGAAPAAGAAAGADQGQRRAVPEARPLPDRRRTRRGLGVSEEDVVDGLAVGNAYTASSLDSPSPEDDGGEGSLADRLGYEDTALEGVEYRESLEAAAGQTAAARAPDHHAALLRAT